ncbi:MAG: hypothetical protein KGN79_11585 [Acidobacteriota bacterium]|nr:hypothetical protein [Acidobacteriota bacterium]
MKPRTGSFILALTITLTALLAPTLCAQGVEPLPKGHTHIVPPGIPPTPFDPSGDHAHPAVSIEFRPAEHMSQIDRELASNAESSVAEHAANSGFNLNNGSWSYQQIVCPALPGHLFLQYTRNNGAGDVTVFSASIPRGQEGRVRIVPILKRSYSLFSPAPINALTISAFNHIRVEEADPHPSNWLGTGLCYAALAGAHPRVPLPQPEFVVSAHVPAQTAHLEEHEKGGEVIRFADAAALPKPMEWSMTFKANGKLVKATHAPVDLVDTRPVPNTSGTIKTWSLPQVQN